MATELPTHPAGVPWSQRHLLWGMTGYQWLVLLAAWLGWGFDAFDALLFNYVANLCVPDLRGLQIGTPEASTATTFWNGLLTSLLLVGWAIGGIMFGRITDLIGRARTLLITMVIYSVATAACAFAPNIWFLAVFRFIASLGIGREWAAGAALVAEAVPERRRIHAGVLLYSASPLGIFLATFVTKLFTQKIEFIAHNPSFPAWRAVFLTGLIPAAIAFLIRLRIKESEVWKDKRGRPRIRDLFTPKWRRRTIGGLTLAVISLISWWSCNAFIPQLCDRMGREAAELSGLIGRAAADMGTDFKTRGTTWFNIGGVIGTFLTIPAAFIGRRALYFAYFVFTAGAILFTFRAPIEPEVKLYAFGLIGMGTYGLCAAFAFYLPELFSTHLRGTGSGFCYNAGRVIAAIGPFAVSATVAGSHGAQDLSTTISWAAVFPLIGIVVLLVGLGEETKGRTLDSHEHEEGGPAPIVA